ncbi:hypothetical protein MASR2M12_07650 [Bacteroidales bacterium]|jgi:hypothetical protein
MPQMLMDNLIVNVNVLEINNMEQMEINSTSSLSVSEMSEIKGNGAVINKNTFDGCSCLYNDHRKVTNENTVAGCSCFCTNPN